MSAGRRSSTRLLSAAGDDNDSLLDRIARRRASLAAQSEDLHVQVRLQNNPYIAPSHSSFGSTSVSNLQVASNVRHCQR
jgi:hypothetical protein